MVNKVDSNLTGLSFAQEATIGVLPPNPVFYDLEPNSYKDLGAQITVTARNPINPTRQRKKGSVTDLVASAGFATDLKPDNMNRLMQGFFYAAAREKFTSQTYSGAPVAVSAVVTGVVTLASAPSGNLAVGSLVLACGFANPVNNGLKSVSAYTSNSSFTLATMVDEAAPPVTACVRVCGYQFAVGDLSIANSGGVVTLSTTITDLTTLGLIPGEWIYIGGDSAASAFATGPNNGFARVLAITVHAITLDKTNSTIVSDAGATKTIQVFLGTIIKNETALNLIQRFTYQVQRTLGQDTNGTVAEYLYGAVPNEFTLAVKAAALVTADVTVTALDGKAFDGTSPLHSTLAGSTEVLPSTTPCYNTVSDFSRIRLYAIQPNVTAPVPLAAYIMDATVTMKNNNAPNHAIGVLGAFDMTAGNYEIDVKLQCYFNSVSAINAIRICADVTFDVAMTKRNQGLILDVPLCALSEGRLVVAKDKPIELPAMASGGQSSFGFTASWSHFAYLPTVIAP